MKRNALSSLLLILALALALGAQTKPPIVPTDYGQWEALAQAGARGGFSPDGRWLVYAINRSNRDSELRVAKLADGTTKTIAFGAQPVFSSDSKWLVYSIGQSEADQKKLRKEKMPVQNQLGLMNLATGEMSVIEGVESFALSRDGATLAMKKYAPQPAAGAAAPGPAVRNGRPGDGAPADEAP
ncbi:MAG: TolB family protein, partial [Candidatus Aminicenantales bacterium]